MISRRKALQAARAGAIGALGAPAIAHAETKTLKITTWGGKWGDIMKATVLPAFEKEFKCTVSPTRPFRSCPSFRPVRRPIRSTTSSTPIRTSSGARSPKGW